VYAPPWALWGRRRNLRASCVESTPRRLKVNHFQDPEPEEPEDIERAWAEEFGRRSAELDSGAVEGIPLEVVSAEVRALLKGSHPSRGGPAGGVRGDAQRRTS
jgi:Putative addiction module component